MSLARSRWSIQYKTNKGLGRQELTAHKFEVKVLFELILQ